MSLAATPSQLPANSLSVVDQPFVETVQQVRKKEKVSAKTTVKYQKHDVLRLKTPQPQSVAGAGTVKNFWERDQQSHTILQDDDMKVIEAILERSDHEEIEIEM